MRLGWTTDIHLNFVNLPEWEAFVSQLQSAGSDAVLLSGDISEADDVAWQLQRLASELSCPIYFVLGNHDFYRGSIAQVRNVVQAASQRNPQLRYLTGGAPVELGGQWVLCGEDGWADARIGDYFGSPIRMNDFHLIADLAGLDAIARYRQLKRLGAAAAVRLNRQLRQAAKLGRNILVLTHIPPFRQSCWYDHQHTNDDWAPFFTCHALGWVLRRFCRVHPQHQVLTLCGHTHHGGRSKIAPNLVVWTGAAEYGKPRLIETLELDNFHYPPEDWTYLT